MRKIVFAFFMVGISAFAADPVDCYWFTVAGINATTYANNNTGYDNAGRALGGFRADYGGVLNMAPNGNNALAPTSGFTFNVANITLGGINFSNTCWCVYSHTTGGIKTTMVGARPFINAEEMTYGPRIGPRWQLQGETTNTLVKIGGGNLTLDDKPFILFDTVEVQDGFLATTSTLETVITDCPVLLTDGGISYKPAAAAEGAASAKIASGGIAVDSLYGEIAIARGDNDSAALAFGPLEMADSALLSIDNSGSLGSSEKITFAEYSSGDMPSSVVLRDASAAGKPYAFATYTADNGITAKSSSAGTATLGNTVLVNTSEVGGFTSETAINFNQERGVIWKASPENIVDMKTRLCGAGGVVFAGRYDAVNPSAFAFYDGDWSDWTGGTALAGVRAVMRGVKPFPADSPVVLDGAKRYGSSSLYFESSLAPENDFVVSGWGYQGDGAIFAAENAKVDFAGEISLADYARFGGAEGSEFTFAKPITGNGSFELASGSVVFSEKNQYGSTHVKNGKLTVAANGTFGTGDVTMTGGTIVFDGNTETFENKITTSGGVVELRNNASPVIASSDNYIQSLSIEHGSSLQVSGYVKINAADLEDGGVIKGIGGTVELYCADDVTLSGNLFDGAGGKLSVIKSGPGVLELSSGHAFSGELTVREGEITLVTKNILKSKSVLYHLDSTVASSVFADENGLVTNLTSIASTAPFSFGASQVANANLPSNGVGNINGRSSISFTRSRKTRLVGTKKLTHRTVFLVISKPVVAGGYSELFGQDCYDRGLRLGMDSKGTFNTWEYCNSFLSYDNLFVNNLSCADKTDRTAASAEPVQIIRMNLNYDFKPSIGGFHPSELGRSITCEFGEIIAFDRVLSELENQEIENYLAKKWGVSESGLHVGVGDIDDHSMSFEYGSINLGNSGILNLNGCDLSVGELTGSGTIRNDLCTASQVSVASGGASFKGIIGPNVVFSGSGDLEIASSGGRLELGSGNVKLAGYKIDLPTDGLLYQLDATADDSMLFDESGSLTNWSSVAGSVKAFYFDPAKSNENWVVSSAPTRVEDGISGKPAVNFTSKQALISTDMVSVRTIFVVARPTTASSAAMSGLWGRYAYDLGLRYNGNYALQVAQYFYQGSIARANGKQAGTFSNLTVHDGTMKPFLVTFGMLPQAGARAKVYNALNLYFWNRGGTQMIGEVIAYSRLLSIEEIEKIENYLRAKWLLTDPLPQSGVAEVNSVVVDVDKNGDVVPVKVEGDVKFSDDASLSYNGEPSKTGHLVLSVDGTVEGSLANVEEVAGMDFVREGNVWRLRNYGLILMIK